MEENDVEQIRKSTRELLISNRRTLRDEEFDSRRPLNKSRFTTGALSAVADKLKTRSAISVGELKFLKNALMDSDKNIKIVLSTNGALRGIVRELSGSDIQKQIEAAACCCNLALGDSKAGMVVTKAAGTYLVTCIDSLSFELAVNCIWALGNLAGAGSKVAEVLIAQGALGKLVHTLDESSDESVQEAIVYGLTHFVYQMKDDLSQESLQKITNTITKLDSKIPKWHLLSLTSCHHEFITSIINSNTGEQLITDLINYVPVSLHNHFSCKVKSDCCDLIFVLRTLASISCETEFGNSVMSFIIETNLVSDFKRVISMNNDVVNVSLYWFLGNLLKYSTDSLSKSGFFHKLVS